MDQNTHFRIVGMQFYSNVLVGLSIDACTNQIEKAVFNLGRKHNNICSGFQIIISSNIVKWKLVNKKRATENFHSR